MTHEEREDLPLFFMIHGMRRQICACQIVGTRHYQRPQPRGCSSVVEHFLAKEDVARSNRVTRSTFNDLLKVKRLGKFQSSSLMSVALIS